MRVGVNQLLLLKRALMKGYVDVSDVRIIYDRSSKVDLRKLFVYLERLELYGFLKRFDKKRFVLTEEGHELVKEIAK